MNIKLSLGALCLATCLFASGAEVRLPHSERDDLVLEVPAEWLPSFNSLSSRMQTVRLQGKDPQGFDATLTLMQPPEDMNTPSDAQLRQFITLFVKDLHPEAVEQDLQFERVPALGGGYCASLASPVLKPNGYKFLTQCLIAVGSAQLSVTLQSNQAPEHDKTAVLAMLASSKLEAAQPQWVMGARDGGSVLVLPRGDWKLEQEKHQANGMGAYYLFSSELLGVNISFWVEKCQACSDGEGCLRLALGNPAYKDRKDQELFEAAGFNATSFYIDASDKMPIDQFNVLAAAYVNGYWLDVHISKVGHGHFSPTPVLAVLQKLQIR